MDREKFLARASSRATTEVTLDDGSTVKARKLSQGEVETIRRKYASDDKALEGYRYIVARTVVDGQGDRMFTDDDAAKLAEVDFEAVQTIALAVLGFSGLAVPKNT